MRTSDFETEARAPLLAGFAIAATVIALVSGTILARLGAAPVFAVTILFVGVALVLFSAGVAGRTIDGNAFFTEGQRLRTPANALALAGTVLSSAVVLGLPGELISLGFDAAVMIFAIPAGLVLTSALFATEFRRSRAWSVPAFLGDRFDSHAVRLAAIAALALVLLPLLHAELRVAAGVGHALLGLPQMPAAAIAGLILVAATMFGGMRSVTFVAVVAAVIVVVAVVVPATFWSLRDFGSPLPMFAMKEPLRAIDYLVAEGVRAGLAQPDSMSGLSDAFRTVDRFNLTLLVLTLPLGLAAMPHVLSRVTTSRGPVSARRSLAYALLLVVIVLLVAPVYAVLAKLALAQTLIGAPATALPDWAYDLGAADLLRVCGTPATSPEIVAAACGGRAGGPLGTGDIAISGGAVLLGGADFAGLGSVMKAMLAAGVLAASVTAAAAALTTLAHSLAQDVLPGRAYRMRSIRRQSVARLVTLAIALAATFVVARGEPGLPNVVSLVSTLGIAAAIAASSLFPALVAAIHGRGATALGVALGVVLGAGVAASYAAWVMLGGAALPLPLLTDALSPMAAAALGLPAALIGLGAGSALSRAAEGLRERLRDDDPGHVPT